MSCQKYPKNEIRLDHIINPNAVNKEQHYASNSLQNTSIQNENQENLMQDWFIRPSQNNEQIKLPVFILENDIGRDKLVDLNSSTFTSMTTEIPAPITEDFKKPLKYLFLRVSHKINHFLLPIQH